MAYRDDIDRDQYRRRNTEDDEWSREYRGRAYERGRYGREEPYRSLREESFRPRSRQGYGGREYGSRSDYGRYSREGSDEGYSDIELGRSTRGRRRLLPESEESSFFSRERDYWRPRGREGELGLESEVEPRSGRESYEREGSYTGGGQRFAGQRRSYQELEEEDRGWMERLTDAIASWFGDEEAARRRRMDERMAESRQGQYRGFGPKGYRRSDERIREDINDRLTDSDYLDATRLEVSVTAGEVILDGFVRERSSKRLAENIAEQVTGVRNVENRIKVDQSLPQLQSESADSQIATPQASKATTTKGS